MRDPLLALLRDLPDETLRAIAERARNDHEPQYTLPWSRLSSLTQHEHTVLANDVLHAAASVLADTPAFRETEVAGAVIGDVTNLRVGANAHDVEPVAPLPDPSGLPTDEVFVLRLHIGDVSDKEPCEECGVEPSDVEDLQDDYVGPFATREAVEKWAEQWANEMGDELDETQTWSWSILRIKPPTKSTPQAGEPVARPAEPPSSSPESKVRTNDYVSVECERTPCSQCPRTADECGCECHTPTPAEPPSLPASEAGRIDAVRREAFILEAVDKRGFPRDKAAAMFDHREQNAERIGRGIPREIEGDRYEVRYILRAVDALASSAPGAVQQDGGEDELSRLYGRDHGPNGPPWCKSCERIRDALKSRSAAHLSSAAGSPGDA